MHDMGSLGRMLQIDLPLWAVALGTRSALCRSPLHPTSLSVWVP